MLWTHALEDREEHEQMGHPLIFHNGEFWGDVAFGTWVMSGGREGGNWHWFRQNAACEFGLEGPRIIGQVEIMVCTKAQRSKGEG